MRIQYSTKHLLVAVTIAACLIGKIAFEMERERRICVAIERIQDIPDNTFEAEIQDPLVLILAVNALVEIGNKNAIEAIRRYALLNPSRNNLQLLWHIAIIGPDNRPELDSCIIVDGLLIKNASRSFVGSKSNRPSNLEVFETVFRNANLIDRKIQIPEDPVPAFRKVFEATKDHKLVVIQQFELQVRLNAEGTKYEQVER